MQRLLKFVVGTFLLLAATTLTLALLTLLKPQVLLNDTTLGWTKSALHVAHVPLSWSTGHVDVVSENLWLKRVHFNLKDLHLSDPAVDMRFDQADVSFAVALAGPGKLLPIIGPLRLDGGSLDIDPLFMGLKPKQPHQPSTPFLDPDRIRSLIQGRSFQPAHIELAHIALQRPKGPLTGALTLDLEHPEASEWRLSLQGKGEQNVPLSRLDFTARLSTPENAPVGPGSRLAIAGDARLRAGGRVQGTATIQPDSGPLGSYTYETRGRFEIPGTHLRFSSTGRYAPAALRAAVTVEAPEIAGRAVGLSLTPCHLTADAPKGWDSKELKAQMNCSGAARPGPLPRLKPALAQLVPAHVGFNITSQLGISRLGARRELSAHTAINLTETHIPPVVASGGATLVARAFLDDLRQPEELRADVNLSAAIADFQQLVTRLKSTPWPVPAPLNRLQGLLACSLNGKLDVSAGHYAVPLACRTALASPGQRLAAEAVGRVDVASVAGKLRPHIDAKITLNDVLATLPRIDPTKPLPRLISDKRIGPILKGTVTSRKTPLSYRIQIRTSRPGALKIASNIAEQPIPVDLKIALKNGAKPQGQVTLGAFAIQLFHRQATVERFAIQFGSGSGSPKIAGDARIDNNDYRIFLGIMGTLAKPRFDLRTEPPLAERDAIAVVLFGSAPESLDDDKLRSAEEARAAMAADAISLVSMYYLAATPIENISFNPLTGVFTAKVKLQEGLSLVLGASTEDTASLGLRKRIGHDWTVETTAISGDSASEKSRGVAMLRWGKRY